MPHTILICSWYNYDRMQDEKVSQVVEDLSKKLHKNLRRAEVKFYMDGWTGAVVFSLDEKYLIKITNSETIETQEEFLQTNPAGAFQHVICTNNEIGYICFEFLPGEKYVGHEIEPHEAIRQIAEMVSNYRKYPWTGYGFLHHEYPTWREFLADEIDYARGYIPAVSIEKVQSALEVIGDSKPTKYLMHGDFGTHNFLVNNGKIYVIDPMPVVGDFLYDFYFAVLSDTKIFTKVGEDFVFEFFERDMKEKRALATIALYVRMSRAWKYDRENFKAYVDMYEKI